MYIDVRFFLHYNAFSDKFTSLTAVIVKGHDHDPTNQVRPILTRKQMGRRTAAAVWTLVNKWDDVEQLLAGHWSVLPKTPTKWILLHGQVGFEDFVKMIGRSQGRGLGRASVR